jgi:hypothetical protein
MVIDAGRIFRCAHVYVAVKERGIFLFACGSCGHKTELLPLHFHEAATGQVVEFRGR